MEAVFEMRASLPLVSVGFETVSWLVGYICLTQLSPKIDGGAGMDRDPMRPEERETIALSLHLATLSPPEGLLH